MQVITTLTRKLAGLACFYISTKSGDYLQVNSRALIKYPECNQPLKQVFGNGCIGQPESKANGTPTPAVKLTADCPKITQ